MVVELPETAAHVATDPKGVYHLCAGATAEARPRRLFREIIADSCAQLDAEMRNESTAQSASEASTYSYR